MKPEQVISYFGSQEKAAKELGYWQSAVAQWVTSKRVPALSQLRIEELTKGQLLADPDIPRGWVFPRKRK